MAKLYDLAVPTDTYEKDGQTKTKWMNIGVVLQGKNGPVMKIDAIPVSVVDMDGNKTAFNGWVNMFEPSNNNAPRQPSSQPQSAPSAVPGGDGFDSIPF